MCTSLAICEKEQASEKEGVRAGAREVARKRYRGREGARETKAERVYLLHTSSGCRSNVVGPYT